MAALDLVEEVDSAVDCGGELDPGLQGLRLKSSACVRPKTI
jgi:hypothetical protein